MLCYIVLIYWKPELCITQLLPTSKKDCIKTALPLVWNRHGLESWLTGTCLKDKFLRKLAVFAYEYNCCVKRGLSFSYTWMRSTSSVTVKIDSILSVFKHIVYVLLFAFTFQLITFIRIKAFILQRFVTMFIALYLSIVNYSSSLLSGDAWFCF